VQVWSRMNRVHRKVESWGSGYTKCCSTESALNVMPEDLQSPDTENVGVETGPAGCRAEQTHSLEERGSEDRQGRIPEDVEAKERGHRYYEQPALCDITL
jgi:hypothetical protein